MKLIPIENKGTNCIYTSKHILEKFENGIQAGRRPFPFKFKLAPDLPVFYCLCNYYCRVLFE